MFIALENEKTKTTAVVLDDGYWRDESVIDYPGVDVKTFWQRFVESKEDQIIFQTRNKAFIKFVRRGGRKSINIFKLMLADGSVKDWAYVGVSLKVDPWKVAKNNEKPRATRYRITFRRLSNLNVLERYNDGLNDTSLPHKKGVAKP